MRVIDFLSSDRFGYSVCIGLVLYVATVGIRHVWVDLFYSIIGGL